MIGRAVQEAWQYDKVGKKWHFLGSIFPIQRMTPSVMYIKMGEHICLLSLYL